MFYWLTDFSDKISFLNVFRYITFRTGGAIVTALVFVFLFGSPMIDLLRLKQGKGQPIRTDGPQSHLVTKKGTPTMGGLMILSGLLVSTLLWANPTSPYVWIVLGVTLSFGLIGFYDDYLKVTKQTHAGFAGRTRPVGRGADRGHRLHRALALGQGTDRDLAGVSILQGAGDQSRLGLRAASALSSSSAPATRSISPTGLTASPSCR